MNAFFKFVVIVCLFAFLAVSCRKDEQLSVVPYIEFISFIKIAQNNKDVKGIIKFSFKDKDGDIGLTQADSVAPYDYNLFIHYYEKQNGVWQDFQFPDSTILPYGRIPYLTPDGQNKAIKGEIEFEIYINDLDTTVAYDTMMFDLYILDRALHKSNVISTPEVIVKKK